MKAPVLYNEVYRHWKETWGKIFTDSGSPESLNVMNFLRQNLVITLHEGNCVVGVLMGTILDLGASATFDHPYFRPFPSATVSALREAGQGRVLTSEYLSVNPEFRKNIVGLSLSDVLIGLLVRSFSQLGGRMLLATTVRPAKVHISAQRYGYFEVGTYEKYGLDCILMCNLPETLCEHPDADVRDSVEQFWERKRDLTGLLGSESSHERLINVA